LVSPTTSAKERIAQRWKRVQAKRAAAKHDGSKDADLDLKIEEVPLEIRMREKVKNKIKKSRDILDAKFNQTSNKVSDLIKNSDFEETKRRTEHEKIMGKIDKKIVSQREEIKEQIEALEDSWAKIAAQSIPQDIYRDMRTQKDAHIKLLEKKRELLQEIEDISMKKKEAYTGLFKAQERDIRNMLWKSSDEIIDLQDQYDKQLIHVECAFVEERRGLIEDYKKKEDKLFSKRRSQELTMLQKTTKQHEKYQVNLEELRNFDYESFKTMKNNLENKIQVTVQDTQALRAKYLLNTEQLLYNLANLKEREKANSQTVVAQEKRFRRLKESLSVTRARYEKQNAEFEKQNTVLSEEFKRTTKQYKELTIKYKHFKSTDSMKYRKIWQMNESSARELLRKIADADQVIYDQILQTPWRPLEFDLKVPSHLCKSKSLLDILPRFGATQKSKENLRRSVAPSCGASTYSHSTHDHPHSKFSLSQKLKVFQQITNQAEFLIEEPLREQLENLPEDQHLIFKIDSIFHALEVEDSEEVEEIIALFYDENGEPCVDDHDYLKTLKSYLESRDSIQTSKKSTGKAAQSQIRERARERRYWDKMLSIIPETKQQTWSILLENLQQYLTLLKDRSELMINVDQLNEKNESLRGLLGSYLKSETNSKLKIQPLQHGLDEEFGLTSEM